MLLESIKRVREATGAGMMEVKKALEEAGGDEEKAIEILRKAGQKVAAKKADRTSNEGLIVFAWDKGKIAVVGLRCETDFVARNKDFQNAVQKFADKLLEVEDSMFGSWANEQIKNELIVKIGENIQLGQYGVYSAPTIGSYLHTNKKVAAVVLIEDKDKEDLARDIAMHVAAMAPSYMDPKDVPADIVEKEKEVYREQMQDDKKPDEIKEKIIEGKLNKYYEEVCLLKQKFVKDDKKTVEEVLGDVKITGFHYFSL